MVLQFNGGTTEGTSLYTFDGGTGKSVDIKAGSNISLAPVSGAVTISSTDEYNGTVTSVEGTGSVNGLTLTGTITSSGTLTLGGSISGLTKDNLSSTAGITNGQLASSTVTFNSQTIPLGGTATITANTPNPMVLQFNGGTTEGTSLYTFDGGTGKSVDIKAGSNISLAPVSGAVTISSTDEYNGTVTSVEGTGSVNGLTLTGTITSSGTLTLGGSISGLTNSNLSGSAGIANSNLGAMAAMTIKGNNTNMSSAPFDLTASEVRSLLNVADGANNYIHPTGDGNLHVPATGTINNGRVLTAGAADGSLSWASSLALGTTSTTAYQGDLGNTAYTDRLKWDGGSTGLIAATGRTSLGATTVGSNLFTLANPGMLSFLQVNADNTVTALGASDFRSAIGVGGANASGTVTSVGGVGSVNGLTLTGTVTTSGNLTLGGSISGLTKDNFSSGAGITNGQLANSTITINSQLITLGGTATLTSNTPNSMVLKFDGGGAEGTSLYTFNGGAGKSVDIKAGNNITLSKVPGAVTISSADQYTGTVSSVTSATPGQLTVSNGTSTPTISVVTGSVVNGGAALTTGNDVYDFVTDLGYVTGTASVTDNAIARFDGTTGKLIQNSGATIDDNGTLTANGNISANGTYYYGDSKAMFQYDDDWLRINPTNAFTGIFAGSGILRTDGTLLVGEHGSTFGVQSGGDFNYKSGLIFGKYSADKVGIGTTTPGAKLDVAGTITGNAIAANAGSGEGLHVVSPGGAKYSSYSASVTGAIKIVLPRSWTSTMMRMTVDIYDYGIGTSETIELGGYNYMNSSQWYNTFAQIISSKDGRDFTVRFGHDGAHCVIYIGELNTSWSYPQIVVHDFYAGVQNYDLDLWDDGWDITIESSAFGAITQTESSNLLYADWNKMKNIPSGLSDGVDAYIGNSGTHTAGGNLSMNNNLITNIGNSGTNFTSNGGLTLAGTFVPNGAITLPTTLNAISGAGTGSGLDADKLDGYNSYDFATRAHENYINVQDIRNTDPTPNAIGIDRGVTAFFNNQWGGTWRSAITVNGWDDGYAAWQLMGSSHMSPDENWYLRTGAGTTWSPWRKIWHDGNDGLGSGLDADLLDGLNTNANGGAPYFGVVPVVRGADGVMEVGKYIDFHAASDDASDFGARLRTNGSGGSLFLDGAKLDVQSTMSGNAIAANSGSGEGLHVVSPGGAKYHTYSGEVTGAIKITLPQSWTNTMMRMTVDIYNYNDGTSETIELGGYNYASSAAWTSTFAQIISSKDGCDFAVRFGHDGTRCAIYIGEINTTWYYPQIVVHDFYAGYYNYELDKWDDGWDITIETSLGTITNAQSSNLPYADWNKMKNIPSGLSSAVSGPVSATDNAIARFDGTTGKLIKNSGITIGESGDLHATDVWATDWFRNHGAGEGLYNSATSRHFYSETDSYWAMSSGHGLVLRDGYNGTPTGYLYWDGTAGSNNFGLLSPDGNWSFMLTNTTAQISDPLTVPTVNTGSGAMKLGDAAIANDDVNSIPTSDQVYDFVTGLGLNKWYDGWVASPGYDANTIGGSKSGFSYANNAPHTGPLVHFDAGGYGLQLSAAFNGGGDAISFRTRNGDATAWNGWNKIWHEDNDGAGSGLDADKLDGKEASEFQLAGNYETRTQLTKVTDYSFSASTNGRDFVQGLQIGAVSSAQGYTNYGTVLRGHTFANDGASFEMYYPYSETYGGNSISYRLGLYNNVGWTPWRTLWDNNNDGAGSGLDADLLDGQHGSYYAVANEVKDFGWVGFTQTGQTTADFINYLKSLGAFQHYHSIMKANWSYAENQDIVDTGFGVLELAGCVVETWTDDINDVNGGRIHVMVTRPTTGSGGGQILVYNDQGSGYSPGWRQIWTSSSDGAGSGLDADLLDGYHADQTGGANTIVQRNGYGYIQTNYFNTSAGGAERNSTGLGYIAGFNTSDYYIRSYTSDAVKAWLGLGSQVAAAGDISFSDTGIGTIASEVVTSAKITNGTITNADVSASAAIAGSKISPDFGSMEVRGLKFTATSDSRLKKNIKTLTNALEKINQLRGVRFEFIDQTKYATGPQIGFVAQELQQVFPELVSTNAEGFLQVNYSQMTAVLLAAIKEQQVQIEALQQKAQEQETKQNQLQEQVSRQQNEIEQIKNMLLELKGQK